MSDPAEIIATLESKIEKLTFQNQQLLNKIRSQVKIIDELRKDNRELQLALDPTAEADPKRPKISTKVEKGNTLTEEGDSSNDIKESSGDYSKNQRPKIAKRKTNESSIEDSKLQKDSGDYSNDEKTSDSEDSTPVDIKKKPFMTNAVPLPLFSSPQSGDLMKEIRERLQNRNNSSNSLHSTSSKSTPNTTPKSAVSTTAKSKTFTSSPTSTPESTTPESTPTSATGSSSSNKYPNLPQPPPPSKKPVLVDEASSPETTASKQKSVPTLPKKPTQLSASVQPTPKPPLSPKPSIPLPTGNTDDVETSPPNRNNSSTLPTNTKEAKPPQRPPLGEKPALVLDDFYVPPSKEETVPVEEEETTQQDSDNGNSSNDMTSRSEKFADIRRGTGIKTVDPSTIPAVPKKPALNPVMAELLQKRGN